MADTPSLRESKLTLVAICISVVLALGGYAVGKIEQNSALEQNVKSMNEKVKTIDENYISREKYNSDIGNLKESLSEIKSDLKEIKRGLK